MVSYETYHPIINSDFKNRENYLKMAILFAAHRGGLTVRQMVHIFELSVNFYASGRAVERFMIVVRRSDLKSRMNMLVGINNETMFNETEKKALLADLLYLTYVGDYDEKQLFSLKMLAAELLGLSKDTVLAVYNTIIKEL